jgi:site-specific DNA recombinase
VSNSKTELKPPKQARSLHDPRASNTRFDNNSTPEGKFVETVFAAQGQLEREQNGRQVRQKTKARLESGFWAFSAPVGYKYVPAQTGGGKIIIPDQPVASSIAKALEGFASGLLASQAEVQRFLENDPYFPKSRDDGSIRMTTVTRLLTNSIYAGYVESQIINVDVRKGQHEWLISFETHQKILDTLAGRKRTAVRRDYNKDFPLRGHVLCDVCGRKMTAAWSKGCRRRYPYYMCMTRGCEEKGKSIRRADVENGFHEILKCMQPSRELVSVATAMISDAWTARISEAEEAKTELARQIKAIEKQTEALLERVVEASSSVLVKAYEERITKLEREKLVLIERVEKWAPPKGKCEECIELALEFLSSPCKVYENGGHVERRLVAKLAFAQPVRYSRKQGYRTPKIAFPFKVLRDVSDRKIDMVRSERLELSRVLPHSDLNAARLPFRHDRTPWMVKLQ